jgi:hypothetical protein
MAEIGSRFVAGLIREAEYEGMKKPADHGGGSV